MTKRLSRPARDRVIGGVCSGLANYFELDVSLVRVGYIFLSIFSAGFPGILVYIIMCFVIPKSYDS